MGLLTKPESSLKPISSEDARQIASHIWLAICNIPKHRHNRGKNAEDCPNCVAYNHLILAFGMFKRKGE